LKRRLLEVWLKQSLMQHLALQNGCWMMLPLFVSLIKIYFALDLMKKSHNKITCLCVTLTTKKHIRAKRYLRTRMTFSHSLMVPFSVSTFDYSSLILLDPRVKINEIVIVACFRHNSCCRSYVRSLASSETVPQRTSHASFLTLISQGYMATRLRCGGIFSNIFIANFLDITTWKDF